MDDLERKGMTWRGDLGVITWDFHVYMKALNLDEYYSIERFLESIIRQDMEWLLHLVPSKGHTVLVQRNQMPPPQIIASFVSHQDYNLINNFSIIACGAQRARSFTTAYMSTGAQHTLRAGIRL